MPGDAINPTTMWTPSSGWAAPGANQPKAGDTTALPWMITNPNAGPGQPDTIQDTSQVGKATAGSWTGTNGLVTTGVMNPFGLNNPSSPWAPHVAALNDQPANNFVSTPANMTVMPDGSWVPRGGGAPANNFLPNQPGMKVMPDGTWVSPAAAPGGASGALPGTPPVGGMPSAAGDPSAYGWLKNVMAGSLDANGNPQKSPTNPMQFADPATAALMAKYMGTQVTNSNLTGPGMGYTSPMAMVGPGGKMNAGLLANQFTQYGSGPGSYGAYEAARDQASLLHPGSQYSSYDQWAASQPGYSAGTRSNIPTDKSYANATTPGGGSYNPGTPNLFGSGGVPSDISSMADQAWNAYQATLGPPQQQPGPGGTTGTTVGNQPVNTNTLPGITGPYLAPTGTTPVSNPAASGPDAALANNASTGVSFLQNIVQQGGNPLNTTPAWQAMVQAQDQQLKQNYANLQASFAASGNRFSSDFGNAAQQYWNQAGANQNSLLGQMTLAAGTHAQDNTLQGATTLANQGTAALSQLSAQDFQALMQHAGFQNSNAQQEYAARLAAAQGYNSSGTQAAQLLAQLAAQGTLGLQQGSITGAGNLFGGSIAGAQGMYGTENAAATQQVQLQQILQQMGLTAAQQASILSQSNLNLGNAIGQQQYQTFAGQNSAAYQEWLRQQPQYSPLLPYMAQAATAYPPMYQPQYQPSWWQSVLGAAGQAAGGIAMALSDRRLKENLTPVGKFNGHTLYKFNYIGYPTKYVGVMADEVNLTHPNAVIMKDGYQHVDYSQLGFALQEVN